MRLTIQQSQHKTWAGFSEVSTNIYNVTLELPNFGDFKLTPQYKLR